MDDAEARERVIANLSPSEVDWLRRHPVIRYSADPAWPPFSVRKGDMVEGVDPDYLNRIATRLGVRFHYVPTTSWEETLQKLHRGEIDVATGIADLPERPLDLLHTRPYVHFPVALIMRSDAPFYTSLRRIEGEKLAMAGPGGYAPTVFLKEHFPGIRLTTTRSSAESLRLVATGEVDAVLENLGVAAHQIRVLGLANLKITGTITEHFDPTMAVRKDSVELQSILNAAIADLGEAEHHAILENWVLVEIAGLWSSRHVRTLGLIALGLFAGGMFLVIFRNVTLRRELRRNRLEGELLRRSEERSRRFFEAMDGPVFLTHPDGRIEFLSESAATLLRVGSRQVAQRLNLRTFLKRAGDLDDLLAEVRQAPVRERVVEFTAADGTTLSCLCHLRLLRDREGAEIGIEWTGTCGAGSCESGAMA